IDLPPKRLMVMPMKWQMQLIGHERFLLITNHTPATSITVVDIARRSVVGEIELPGCMLTYPTGQRGFTTLCGDGKMITYQLDTNGQQTNMIASEAFNDIAGDPMFEEAVIINGIGYFPTFKGQVQEIDFRGEVAKLGRKWSLTADNPPAQGWRPGGLQLTGQDTQGRLYVLMHPEGAEGTHKDGGSEVWIYDVKARKRIMRMPLKTWAVTIEVTQGGNPLLLTTNVDMQIDVYNISNGDHLRTLSNFGADTPFMMHAVSTGRP
ncbi:MAG: amine dehydrogenase, partial [Gammaproteobacteria bacterium]|nr:amine dehydrogenase [Gammaproteobacteria bacterium]